MSFEIGHPEQFQDGDIESTGQARRVVGDGRRDVDVDLRARLREEGFDSPTADGRSGDIRPVSGGTGSLRLAIEGVLGNGDFTGGEALKISD